MKHFLRHAFPVWLGAACVLLGRSHAATAPTQPSVPTPPGWTLTFDDEFSGKTLDLTKWTPTDWASTINNEAQYYTPDEVSVEHGYLRLGTHKRKAGGRDYTSGEVRSVGKFSQLYGRFEFRARLPQTQGTWSAEYLIAENDIWPPEIDVEEFLGKDPTVLHMTTHWQEHSGHHGVFHYQEESGKVDYAKWHVFAVEWDPGVVRWYIDDVLQSTTPPRARPYLTHVPMYLRINTALGGWAGGPDETSVWPQFHDLDWVRVYRRSAMAPPVNAGPDQEITAPAQQVALQGVSCSPMGPHVATWSQVSGPGQVAFDKPHALTTGAHVNTPGTYRLRLTVSDGAVSAYDDLTVRVNPAEATQLLPNADAYSFVNNQNPGIHVDGTAQDLLIGSRPSLEESRDRLQSYLNFDLSHAPKASHAVLRLYGGEPYNSEPVIFPCELHAVPAPNWDEKAASWEALPTMGDTLATLSLRPFVHHGTERWYEVDVTPQIQALQQAGQNQAGFALVPPHGSTRIAATFHSREDAAHAPHLILTP